MFPSEGITREPNSGPSWLATLSLSRKSILPGIVFRVQLKVLLSPTHTQSKKLSNTPRKKKQ